MPTTVIVGGVASGMSAATRLRRLDETREIIVFERSGYVSFANCGLPYHLGGIIEDREELLLQTPESLHRRFRIDVRVNHEVTAINREAKTVQVTDAGGHTFTQPYDELVLAPGAVPFVPKLEGAEHTFALRNIEDLDRLMAKTGTLLPGRPCVVMGAGFIGLEVAENLAHRGLSVTVVELAPQVMAPLDEELAALVEKHLVKQGIKVITGQAVTAVTANSVTLTNGETQPADLVIAAIGVQPDNKLAKEAGLSLHERGGIMVDETCRTSDPNIFAAGDAVTKTSIFGGTTMIPLANPANMHGRLIADVIAGRPVARPATLGTAIIGLFGQTAAATGLNERQAKAAGFNVQAIHTHPADHAGYYPGAEGMSLKLVLETGTWRILGAQGVGGRGVDKRIDVIATAIKGGLTGPELADLELAYAPPFGSAKDPVNMLGLIAGNIADGLVQTVQWHELSPDDVIIDVRSPGEFARGTVTGARNVPLDELRNRLDEVPDGAVLHCQVGLRGYLAARILSQNGINTRNLDGGYRTWARI